MMNGNPLWHFMYRGCGYGPFLDIQSAWNQYREKCMRDNDRFGTKDWKTWYTDKVIFGIVQVNSATKKLIRFERYPKPLIRAEHRYHCRLCGSPSHSELVLYPCGYST